MVYIIKDNKLIIKVKVIPGSSRNYIDTVKNNELVIKINAVPEKGKANKELIKFLAKELNTVKSEIDIISGSTSRHKLLSLPEASYKHLKDYLTCN